MLNAVFIDDEPLALRQLEMYASKVPGIDVLAACTSASSARNYLKEADALFVDINMPDISGLDFVRSLDNPPLVVFTTAYAEFALEGFRVNAVDYLLKPFSLEEFRRSVEKLTRVAEMRSATLAKQPFYLKSGTKTIALELDNVLYVESLSEYVKIHLSRGAEPVILLYSLKKLADELPSDLFMRIHRSYIAALKHISEATALTVCIDGQVTLPVSELYRPAFRQWLNARQPSY
ncbi:MAG: LytTR family DNA-binding domain-containing protein [Bacteroidales bacterium]|nr:LytTR family DNA-binding domain-containing protein [Bacteroidales bacterium]